MNYSLFLAKNASNTNLSTPDFSTMNFLTPWFKNSWFKSMGFKSSWLKSLGLKGAGLKLGVEKSLVEMSLSPRMKHCTRLWITRNTGLYSQKMRNLTIPVRWIYLQCNTHLCIYYIALQLKGWGPPFYCVPKVRRLIFSPFFLGGFKYT